MKVGDIVKHTPSGGFVIIMDLSDYNAFICFTTGVLVGYTQWYSTNYLEEL